MVAKTLHAPAMRGLFPILFGCLFACHEEAIVHPPQPPPLPTGELSLSAAASAPVSPSTDAVRLPASAPKAETTPKSRMTMETLMQDYIEPVAKKALKQKNRNAALDDLLDQVGDRKSVV